MKETEWAKIVAKMLNEELSHLGNNYVVEAGKKLIYANEIVEYGNSLPKYNEMVYETDILIYEKKDTRIWTPRVVIETKLERVTTHDAIIYSQKSASHKYVHPYLRYGIFLGKRLHHPLPGRLFRHGSHFDFMLSWKDFTPEDFEKKALIEIVKKEIRASQILEKIIFDTKRKDRKKYYMLHKPLVMKES